MPVRFLDLDELNKPVGEVSVGGKTYPIYPLSVQALINLSVLSEKNADSAEQMKAQMETALDILREFIPDCGPAVFQQLNLTQMQKLLAFARDVAEDGLAKNSESPVATSPSTFPR